MRSLLLALVITVAVASAANAQYYLDTPKGYRLEPASPANRSLELKSSSLYGLAAQCTGIELDGLFRVEGGMSRFFELDRSRSFDQPDVREHLLSAATQRRAGGQTPVRYQIDGAPVYVAFGRADQGGYADYVVATFTGDASSLVELDRFTVGAEFAGGIYALDLTGDGVTELAVPYATGAGGGGGIEVRAIVPTGGLAWFGNDELDSTLFSQTGYINLLDYDGDGAWEIETMAPVLCSACGYMWNDLWSFDREGWNWENDPAKHAAYYRPQQDFYRQLNAAVQKLAAQPSALAYSGSALKAEYAAQIGGQWYSLDVFIPDGRLDKTWVSQLKSLVEGWN